MVNYFLDIYYLDVSSLIQGRRQYGGREQGGENAAAGLQPLLCKVHQGQLGSRRSIVNVPNFYFAE